MRRRSFLSATLGVSTGAGFGLAAPSRLRAQAPAPAPASASAPEPWPVRPVRIVVPFAAGGPVDTPARVIADRLSERFGSPFIVDNRAGAGGAIGAQFVAQAAPDGGTLLFTSSSVALAPTLQPNVRFDPINDLTPISLIADIPTSVVARLDGRVKSLGELIALARANPGSVSFGTGGVGSSNHLAGSLLASTARIDLLHVPYRGVAPAMTALYAGDIDLVVSSTVETVGHYRQGRVRMLTVMTPQRLPALPDVPAAAEVLPGFAATNWFAMMAPRGLAPALVQRLSAELMRMRDSPELRARFADAAVEPTMSAPAALAERVASEVPKWRRVVSEMGIRAQ
ncbi:MAG: tripartite tricarboxylate transporter substrate binding protein [Alphaproteobacteria bacterium]|nr:tripartite tricarboxylate transporter substrate binding protein [Alphaproteobacteria bacterium]